MVGRAVLATRIACCCNSVCKLIEDRLRKRDLLFKPYLSDRQHASNLIKTKLIPICNDLGQGAATRRAGHQRFHEQESTATLQQMAVV